MNVVNGSESSMIQSKMALSSCCLRAFERVVDTSFGGAGFCFI